MVEGVRHVTRKALQDYLAGALYWSGAAREAPGRGLARAARWYADLVGQGLEDVPFAVAHDLGHMLLAGRTFRLGVTDWFDRYPAEERGARVAYGNGFLAALLERGWFVRAADLVMASEEPDPAVSFCLERILGRLVSGAAAEWVVQPSAFAQLPWDRVAAEVRDRGPLTVFGAARAAFEDWAGEPGLLRRQLEAFLDAATMKAGAELMGELEFFELANLPLLDTREKRLAARQLKQAELLLPPFQASARALAPEVEEVEVEIPDEGTYPSGGLEGLSNRGSWENLLPSELLYMEDAGGEEPDMFVVRALEGELLFYTRDGGHLRRRRRAVHLVVELDEGMRVKYPEHPYRLDCLVEGLATRLVGDVLAAFEGDACAVHVHLLGPGRAEVAERLCLRFAPERRRREVTVEPARELDPATWCEAVRKSYCVWIGRRPPFDARRRRQLEADRLLAYWIQVGGEPGEEGPTWRLPLPLDRELVLGMTEARDRLVQVLLGGA